MTWDEYADKAARALAACATRRELDARLAEFDEALAGTRPPADFWERVASRYPAAPKPLLRDTLSAAAMNALLIAAEAAIKARAQARK